MIETPFLIVGLGNPGTEYEYNRHNIGFMALDAIADKYSLTGFRRKFKGQMVEGKIDGRKVILLKPETFMNLSGQSVSELASYYKIPVSKMVIIHDELDLPPGKLRVKTGGGAAGHNGLKSLDQHLPSNEYHRIRIGIGHPGDRDMVSNYVLSDFAKVDKPWIEDLCAAIGNNITDLIDGKPELFMTRVAEATGADEKKKEKKEV